MVIRNKLLFTIPFTLLLFACSPIQLSGQTYTALPSSTPTQSLTPTITLTNTPTFTITPTVTLTSTLTIIPTITFTPLPEKERYFELMGDPTFSIIPPRNWKNNRYPNYDYSVWNTRCGNQYCFLRFESLSKYSSVESAAKGVVNSYGTPIIPDVILSETITTSSGINGLKIIITYIGSNGDSNYIVTYFLQNIKYKFKIIMAVYGRPPSSNSEWDEIIEQSITSFQFIE